MIPFLAALNVFGTASSLLDKVSDRRADPAGASTDEQAKSPTSFASLLKSEGVDVSQGLHKSLSTLTGGAAGGGSGARPGSATGRLA